MTDHYLAITAPSRTANWVDSIIGKTLVDPSGSPSLVSNTDNGLSSQDPDSESSHSPPPRMVLRYPDADGRPDVTRHPTLPRNDGLRSALSLLGDYSDSDIGGSTSSLVTIGPPTNHDNPQLRPYPSSTNLQSNGSVYHASFMTTPSYASLTEVSSDTAEVYPPGHDRSLHLYSVGLKAASPVPDPTSSATPDPTSSLDDYASQSSSLSSSPEPFLERTSLRTSGTTILELLDELHESRGPAGSALVDDPPRKLILSSPALQVVNPNTVKDRFLFLFNNLLVIAKPVTHDYDALLDSNKSSPLDRKFIMKSVVQLRDVRLIADRDDLPLSSFASISQNPLLKTFVAQFAKDADNAIFHYFDGSGTRDDPKVLGQLLFRMLDLDRATLGGYLSRRTSKVVLKAFIECFGFKGVRIDRALRVFLQSLHLAPLSRYSNPLDYVSDTFASRWYDTNGDLVAYDKDLAIRLVRGIIQLNNVLYGGVVHDPWAHVQIKRNVTNRDFIDAFRRYDPRCLVSDELLDRIHTSIRREPLSQACNSTHSTTPNQLIVFKRPIPTHLTYRIQSEPIIVRIPQADPSLTIHLHGNELIFDPPYLVFIRSAEASFRITGTTLGLKTVLFTRSGPSALLYSGLPLSSPIMIERSYMRNTFQIAFVNHQSSKRRYMFSVYDPIMRHNWTVSLKRQINIVSAGQQAQVANTSSSHQSAEQVTSR